MTKYIDEWSVYLRDSYEDAGQLIVEVEGTSIPQIVNGFVYFSVDNGHTTTALFPVQNISKIVRSVKSG